MRTWRDQFVKNYLEALLNGLGFLETQHEIAAADAQWADVWFEPDPAHSEERLQLGWLGRISELPCLFESFSNMPNENEVRACLRKVFTKQHRRLAEAEKSSLPEPILPKLWIIAPSLRPAHAEAFGLDTKEPWPAGILAAPNGYALGWISLRDLPCSRDTLLLRLLAAAGPIFNAAVKELTLLPKGAIEKQVAAQILIARRIEIENNPVSDAEEEAELSMNYRELYQQWKREQIDEGKREGRVEGQLEGVQSSILEIYRARFGHVPAQLEQAVRLQCDASQLMAWCNLFATHSPDEIARALNLRDL